MRTLLLISVLGLAGCTYGANGAVDPETVGGVFGHMFGTAQAKFEDQHWRPQTVDEVVRKFCMIERVKNQRRKRPTRYSALEAI